MNKKLRRSRRSVLIFRSLTANLTPAPSRRPGRKGSMSNVLDRTPNLQTGRLMHSFLLIYSVPARGRLPLLCRYDRVKFAPAPYDLHRGNAGDPPPLAMNWGPYPLLMDQDKAVAD